MSTAGNKMEIPSRPPVRHQQAGTRAIPKTLVTGVKDYLQYKDPPKKRDQAMPEDYRWQTFEVCRDSDMVNCSFGEEGPCLNAKHQPKWLREKLAARNGAQAPMEIEG